MGCGESQLKQKQEGGYGEDRVSLNRHGKKQQKFKVDSQPGKSTENVTKCSDQVLTEEDFTMTEQIFSKHYLFYKLKEAQRRQLINSMEVYSSLEGNVIFKKGDAASLFFMIKKGRVLVQIGNNKRNLEEGTYFGELALLYKAPRSATIKAAQDCVFLCISHEVFRRSMQEMIKKDFNLAKQHIEKASIFRYLTSKERNLLAYNTNTLRFEKDAIIFKERDDANSFFIVIKGKIDIEIPGKKKISVLPGESFGENSFEENQVRSGTARAAETTDLLAIGGSSMKKYLGGQLRELTFYNIIKWSLQRNTLFNWMSQIDLERIISLVQLKKYKNYECICQGGQVAKFIVICLEQKINSEGVGTIFNCEYLMSADSESDLRVVDELTKNGSGYVALIPFLAVNKVLGKSIYLLINKPLPKEQLASFEETKKKYMKSLKVKDLIIKYKLGEGEFGKVFCVEDKFKKVYAVKCIPKKRTIMNNMEEYIVRQREILQQVQFPFINKYYHCFHDQHFIYLLLRYIDGGDFFHVLRHLGLLNKEKAQFYFGSLLLAIEYLHSQNIIYRDLKPENAVVDQNGYLCLVDLGTAKVLNEDNGYRTFTIIGTPHYMAPEVAEGQGYTFSTDLWSLGIILFEMVCGRLPFGNDADDPYQILDEVANGGEPTFPQDYEDPSGMHLILELLKRDPVERHVDNFVKIKNRAFFCDFDWEKLGKKVMNSPFKINREKLNISIYRKLEDFIEEEKKDLGDPIKSQNKEWNKLFS